MAIARSHAGVRPAVSALASQVHPVFMLPPIAVAAFGAITAGAVDPVAALLHASAIFLAVYVAHVKDGYVDFYHRGEDNDHPLSESGCRIALVGASIAFGLSLIGLFFVANPLAVALTLPTWVIAYLHAPTLDMTPVTATMDYPVGIGLALLGGYAVQTGSLAAAPLAIAAVLVVLLTGIKIIDDAQDVAWDRDFGKRTVAVRLGRRRARRLSYAILASGCAGVIGFAVANVIPDGTAIGVFVFGAVASIAVDAEDDRATELLIRGSYLLLAGLVVAVWFHPLSGGIDVSGRLFGPSLYLASEVLFGLVAFGLLRATDSVGSAARTIAVIYPVAFLWDWYTLHVGVFAILRRSGIVVLGIPLEEHLFIVVVTAFIVGLHEARIRLTEPDESP